MEVGGFWRGGGLVVRGGCRRLSLRGCRFFPALRADVIVIRQRGPAVGAEVHGGGSFAWEDKGWDFSSGMDVEQHESVLVLGIRCN